MKNTNVIIAVLTALLFNCLTFTTEAALIFRHVDYYKTL